MILDLTEFLRDDVKDANYDFTLENLPEELQDLGIHLPLQYHIYVYKIANILEVETNVDLRYTCYCNRCLKKLSRSMNLSLESTYPLDSELIDFYEEDPNSDLLILDNNKIDTTKLVRDIIVSKMPMREICSEDCKGLCPKCGADLNKEECNCDDFTIDPRLEALSAFKPD
ncbi:MAG: DUF177 domain-containing protein [Tissierellia bacterium]|nr:DUF177 domain-containing protein [Tissierellia bacterium]